MTIGRITSERRELEKKKKRAQSLMDAFCNLAKAKMKRQQRHYEGEMEKAAAADGDIAYNEAKLKILEEEEDVTPPQWDALDGWVDVSIKSTTTYELKLKDDHDYVGAKLVDSTTRSAVSNLKRRKFRFDLGSFRVVYLATLNGHQKIAKYLICPRDPKRDLEEIQSTVHQYELAKHVVKRFRAALKERGGKDVKMKYISTELLTLTDGKQVMIEECAGEEFRRGDGKFIKWNNNGEMVKTDDRGYPGGIDPIPQALSHFSYVDSKITHLLTDVQGWRPSENNYIFTDPAFHSDHRKTKGGFRGGSDRGERGMKDFFRHHKCNEFCKLLKLDREHKPAI